MSRARRRVTIALAVVALLYGAIAATLYAWQRDLLFVGSVRPVAPPPAPPGYRDLRLTATDGTPLRAWYRPAAAGKPVILFFHGNGDTIAGSAAAVRPYVARGYGAMLPEYRGYGGMPGRPSEALVSDDADRALGWLKAQGIADRAIVMMGYSLGSGVATQTATRFRPRALVLFAGYASIDRVAAARFWFLPVRSLLTEHFDSAAKLPRVAAPVLLLHGDADGTVPYDNLAVLRRARSDAAQVTAPGVGHDIVYLPVGFVPALAWLERLPSTSPVDMRHSR